MPDDNETNQNQPPADEDLLEVTLDDEEPLPPVAAPPSNVLVIDTDHLRTPAPLPAAGSFPTAEPVAGGKAGKGKPSAAAAIAVVVGILTMMLAGAIGGALAWVLTYPFIHDLPVGAKPEPQLLGHLLGAMGLFFACAGGMIGMALGAVEGLLSHAWEKAARAGGMGLAIGAAGGFVGGVIGQAFYGGLGGGVAGTPSGAQILVRGLGWALVGLFVGLSLGVISRSRRRMINGLIGGLLGGLAGGLLFDPIHSLIVQAARLVGGQQVDNHFVGVSVGGGLSRLVALAVVGLACGAAISAIEQVRKEAWLRIVEGPLTGKQFILYRSPTIIGSSAKCDIALAADKSVAPQHAALSEQAGRHSLADLGTPTGTRVNGQPIRSRALRSGDRITIGQTTLLYTDRVVSS